jgi:hypothetical protein
MRCETTCAKAVETECPVTLRDLFRSVLRSGPIASFKVAERTSGLTQRSLFKYLAPDPWDIAAERDFSQSPPGQFGGPSSDRGGGVPRYVPDSKS